MKFKLKGPKEIIGTINISGSKNACLPIIAGALLTNEEVILYNVPLITDVISMIRILDDLGVDVKYNHTNQSLLIHPNKIKKNLTSEYVTRLRASYYLISPLIHRKKELIAKYPGGCNFGKRPIDLHLKLYRELGINITEEEIISFKRKKIHPLNITFPTITVGGTINAILSTVLVKGTSVLSNVAIEPEVLDVINFLKEMGASINFISERKIQITGVKKLHGITYKIMPDRIEAGSYLLLALAKKNSKITINNIDLKPLKNIIDVLIMLNAKLDVKDNSITVYSPNNINGIKIKTGPYPDFPTDLQPILSTILLNATGTSEINETIYPTRDSHVKELKKLKGNIHMNNGIIKIGPSVLISGIVNASDLRCGFAMIVVSAITEKQMIINNAEYILRGYENIKEKLSCLGITCNIM